VSCPRCEVPNPLLMAEERWALVGNPNTGKSSLINALAGAGLEVGNWPGTTLERLSAYLRLGEAQVELVDLPGTYSLLPTSPEEALVLKELLRDPPDRLLLVLDGGNLERSLVLALEAMELALPTALVVNLLDEAKAKGLELDLAALEEALGLPVAGAVAARGRVEGVLEKALAARVPNPPVRYPPPLEEALARLEPLIPHPARRALALLALLGEEVPLPEEAQRRAKEERERLLKEGLDPYLLALEARYAKAQEVYRRAARRKEAPPSLTERLDRLVLHPFLGLPLFLFAFFLAFRFTFALSAPWVDFLGRAQEVLAGWTLALPLPPSSAPSWRKGWWRGWARSSPSPPSSSSSTWPWPSWRPPAFWLAWPSWPTGSWPGQAFPGGPSSPWCWASGATCPRSTPLGPFPTP
jgi:ferrous iron transport protein B